MNREVQLNLPITISSVGLKDAKPIIRVRRVLNSRKSLKFAQQFSRPGKRLKVEIKSGKMVKSLDFFKATTSALDISESLFVFVKSYSISPVRIMKKALSLRFFRKTQECIDHWI